MIESSEQENASEASASTHNSSDPLLEDTSSSSIFSEEDGSIVSSPIENFDATIDPCVSSPKPSPRSKQRQFVSGRLQNLKTIDRRAYSEVVVQPVLQYFVANLCDLKIEEHRRRRIGLHYAKTPEVQRLIERVAKAKIARHDITATDPNVIISALKQLLTDFPGGIFDDRDEEFLCVSLHSSLEIALAYVNGLVEPLPIFLRQFTYLVCKSLRNLAQQSSGPLVDSYTDLLLLFTPVLFPNSVGDVSRFLRATRITLILVDMCDHVFRPFLSQSALTDSAYHSNDEEFFADVLNTLNQLQDSFHVPNEDAEQEEEDDDFWLDSEVSRVDSYGEARVNTSTTSSATSNNNSEYYQITYIA